MTRLREVSSLVIDLNGIRFCTFLHDNVFYVFHTVCLEIEFYNRRIILTKMKSCTDLVQYMKHMCNTRKTEKMKITEINLKQCLENNPNSLECVQGFETQKDGTECLPNSLLALCFSSCMDINFKITYLQTLGGSVDAIYHSNGPFKNL